MRTAMNNAPKMIGALLVTARAAVLATLFLVVTVAAAGAVTIQEVRGKSGVTAWLVEDYTVPIITLSASFRGGSAQDAEGREGTASLLSTLFDEGAGPYDSKQFQARVEKLGITLNYGDSRDNFSVTLRTLKSDSADAFEMMRLSLTDLHFAEDSIERMRAALKARILRRENNPSRKASDAMRTSLFAGHPYSRPTQGTPEGLDAISVEDLRDFFARNFARDNLTVGVVGAINAEETIEVLDHVFGDLPERNGLNSIPDAEVNFGARIDIPQDQTQSTITLALPGVMRNDADFFAAYLMNHILGGGGFTSRLYNEVREKRGLAYSVYSDLSNYDHAALLTLGAKTKAESAGETLGIVRSEIERMAKDGPTEEELEMAKRYVIGAYAINNLDTTTKIARTLVSLQEEDLGRDYIDRRGDLINAVSVEDVKAVARRVLSAEPTIVVVGPGNS